MNLFMLSECPIEAAQFNCDKHCVKIILEAAAMLCNAHHENDSQIKHLVRGKSYYHHPISKWIRASQGNYQWAADHCIALCKEYTYRYDKEHAWEELAKALLNNPPILPLRGFTFPHLGMPDDCKTSNFVDSYRDYYQRYKVGTIDVKYTKRKPPSWLKLNA